MVVEVNNTFDERRMYFMERKVCGGPVSKEAERHFKHSWQKDFQVSPFNPRDSSYTIQATDPYADDDAGDFTDCSIVLKTADQKVKMVARVLSTASAVNAMSMTRWQTLAFVFRWWLVGLMTNPWILHKARILWVRKPQVYYRLEVMNTGIGRLKSHEEAQLKPYSHPLLERLTQDGLLRSYMSAAAGYARDRWSFTCRSHPPQ
jgi:DUF1365 family protein